MVTLNVLSVNGNTALANASYPLNALEVELVEEDPSNSAKCFVDFGSRRTRLLVDDTVADVITALVAGVEDAPIVPVTLLKKRGRSLPSSRDAGINLNYVVSVTDDTNSNASIAYIGPSKKGKHELSVDETTAAIVALAAGLTPAVQLVSKTVFSIDGRKLPTATVYALNQNHVVSAYLDGTALNEQATGTVRLRTEDVTNPNAGTGYTAGDDLTVTFDNGAVIVINVDTVDGGGAITAFTVSDKGIFSTIPADRTDIAATGGTGANATFTVTDFEVDSIAVTNSGDGYTSATATLSAGTATVTISNGKVASTTITGRGDNLVAIPTMTFSAPQAKTAWKIRPVDGHQKTYIF